MSFFTLSMTSPAFDLPMYLFNRAAPAPRVRAARSAAPWAFGGHWGGGQHGWCFWASQQSESRGARSIFHAVRTRKAHRYMSTKNMILSSRFWRCTCHDYLCAIECAHDVRPICSIIFSHVQTSGHRGLRLSWLFLWCVNPVGYTRDKLHRFFLYMHGLNVHRLAFYWRKNHGINSLKG